MLSQLRGRTVPGFMTSNIEVYDAILAAEARLRRAEHYVDTLRGAAVPRSIVAFSSLPVVWARTELNRMLFGVELEPAVPSYVRIGGPLARKSTTPPS
jgi:hypothetical protein